MNIPTGIQVPATLLPAIDAIIGNELVLMFVVPGAKQSIVESHWTQLQELLGSFAVFIDLRDRVEEVGEFDSMIRNLRKQRDEYPKPRFVLYNFAPRFSRLELEADVSFFYCPGAGQVNLQRGKCRRAATPNVPKVLELIPPVTPLGRAAGRTPALSRLQVIIAGDRPGDGKTALAVELRNFLAQRFPATKVVHYCSEDVGTRREANTAKQTVTADEIQVIDNNARPIKPEKLCTLPVRRMVRPRQSS